MKDLTNRYKVGLSPIREALHRLLGEGCVQSVGQRGFTVPPLSRQDLEDITALRRFGGADAATIHPVLS